MDKIYIFGHKNPDTDSVTSAISLSYLKNELGYKTIPCILGEVNNETKYVLDYFNVREPIYLNDTRLQVKDLKYKRGCYINYHETLNNLYNYMQTNEITGLPICNDNLKYLGIVTMKDLLKIIIDPYYDSIYTSYDNIINTLNGQKILKFDDEIDGNLLVSSFKTSDFEEKINLTNHHVLIVGNRLNIIRYAIKSGVKLLIIVGNATLDEDVLKEAKKNKINIIYSPLDSFHTSKAIILSNYIKNIVSDRNIAVIEENTYAFDFEMIFNKYKFTNYPIVNKNNKVLVLLRMEDMNEKNPKKVILVDHNEYNQSVLGIEEADIIEIIDHHKIGNVNSSNPINFRNMAVGSTNTIIYEMYREHNLVPPKDIAGLMLSGILSDTLVFHSPTTTSLDKEAAACLSKISKVDIQKFSKKMFEAGASTKGKTIEELIYNDFKSFNIKDKKVGIGQMTVINYQSVLDNKEAYLEVIEEIAKEHNYAIFAFCITDVINSNTYILYNENSKSVFETIFNIQDIYQGYQLKGVVSRKKQIIPLLMDELNN